MAIGREAEMKRFARLVAVLSMASWPAGAGAAVTDLLELAQWQVYGTAAMQGSTLTIGDSIGYDKPDADKDGNPYNIWYGGTSPGDGQGVDYDEAVTLAEFKPPFTLSWSGCFPVTRYGYNNIFIGRKNPSFTGASGSKQYLITQEFGFTQRWDHSGLNTIVLSAGGYDIRAVSGATLSGNNYCGDFKIIWANDSLKFYYNNTLVREQTYAYVGPVSVLVRNFDLPHTFTALTMEAGTTQQNTGKNPGLGMLYGANISGSITDSAGKTTPLTASNTGISGDLSFIYSDAGDLIAQVSGTVATNGMSFNYNVNYDVVSGNLTGTYADNKDNVPHAITFTNTGGLQWNARVQGSGHGADGKANSYDVSFDIVLPQEAVSMGSQYPPGGRYDLDLTQTTAISVPVSIPALGISQNISTSVISEGRLIASLVPSATGVTLTGSVEGAFRMDPEVVISGQYTVPQVIPGYTIPPVNYSVTVDATGRFSGVLTGNSAENNMKYVGNWSSVSSNGATGGGTLEMAIPLTASGQLPATAQLLIQGTVTAPIDAGTLPVGVSVPTSMSQPISTQITIPLTFSEVR